MAQLSSTFTLNPNETEKDFELLPAGEYKAIIVNSDYKANSKGTGMIMKLEYDIIDGPMKGRKLFENLSLEHENKQTAVIAQQALNSILLATGLGNLKDTAQLHGIPMIIKVKVQPAKGEYEPSNRITKHLPLSGAAPAPSQSGTYEAAPAAAKTTQPWKK